MIERVQARHTVAPHACAITGRGDSELIDFKVEVMGRLYMRETAFTEIALELGFVPQKDVETLMGEMKEMGDELEKLHKLFAALERQEEANAEVDRQADLILSD